MRRRLFSTDKKSSSILLIGALIPSSGLFVANSLFLNSSNNSSLLLLYFQSVVAIVFGAVFFAPAWGRMPLKTEGEFIPYRFIGKGAVALARFRGLYLGLLILPLAMAVSIRPLAEFLFSEKGEQGIFIGCTFGILALNVFFNSLKNRIRIDSVIGYATILIASIYFIVRIVHGDTHSAPRANHFVHWLNHLHLTEVLWSLTVLWWFATILDLPDMRGQLLLTSKDGSKSRRNLIYSFIISYFIQGILLTFPLVYSNRAEWDWLSHLFLAFIILNAFQAMFNTNHWTASLIYSGVIRPLLTHDNYERTFGIIAMFLSLAISALWISLDESTSDLFSTIFLFTAGVGPVFIARWFWSKVNAQTVLSAMIGAPLIWMLWLLVKQTEVYPALISLLGLSDSFIDILLPGLANTLVWLITMRVTRNEEEVLHAKHWINEVGPYRELCDVKNWLLFLGLTLLSGLLLFGPTWVMG
jgi:hypothetical protein